MLYSRSFQRKITLAPFELRNVNNNVRKQIAELIGTCSKDSGYIVHIQTVHFQSMTNRISRVNGKCEFTVSFDATCMLPEVGETVLAQTEIVFSEGVLLRYKQMKIIIPSDKMASESVKKGDMVWTRIDVIRYDKGEYQCIGTEIKK